METAQNDAPNWLAALLAAIPAILAGAAKLVRALKRREPKPVFYVIEKETKNAEENGVGGDDA